MDIQDAELAKVAEEIVGIMFNTYSKVEDNSLRGLVFKRFRDYIMEFEDNKLRETLEHLEHLHKQKDDIDRNILRIRQDISKMD